MNLAELVPVLRATPATLSAWLGGLPPAFTEASEGGASWSAREIVAHLIHGELEDWVPRARVILEQGPAQPFTAFDPAGFATVLRPDGAPAERTLPELLEQFANLRSAGLEWLVAQHFDEHQLALPGTHPAFGAVTVRELLWTWVAHDQNHLAQIARVLCHQVAPGVGPWRAYLPLARG